MTVIEATGPIKSSPKHSGEDPSGSGKAAWKGKMMKEEFADWILRPRDSSGDRFVMGMRWSSA